jgi:hypothetical protein
MIYPFESASNAFSRKVGALEIAGDFRHGVDMRKTAQKLPPVRSHQMIDLVELAVHRAIVRKIRREPKLYGRARRTLARWERVKRACPPPLREWKLILQDNDMKTVFQILTWTDDEGNRLRSISPFRGILTQREVAGIWARYDKK